MILAKTDVKVWIFHTFNIWNDVLNLKSHETNSFSITFFPALLDCGQKNIFLCVSCILQKKQRVQSLRKNELLSLIQVHAWGNEPHYERNCLVVASLGVCHNAERPDCNKKKLHFHFAWKRFLELLREFLELRKLF